MQYILRGGPAKRETSAKRSNEKRNGLQIDLRRSKSALMNRSFAHLLCASVGLLCIAAAKKEDTTVRFHTETQQQDGQAFAMPVRLQHPARNAYVSKVPAISERDIVAIYPFQAKDGSWGCLFQLDAHGRIALDTLSIEKRGTSLVAAVNGRQVIDLQIDRRISDGLLTIPRGLTQEEIASLQKAFPLVGGSRSGAGPR
jgi:hypothetical protein